MKWRRSYLLLLAAVVLMAGLLLVLSLPPSNSFEVKGPLSTQDVQSIRRELRRGGQADFRHSILHCRFSSLWDRISVTGTCPLVSIESSDGNSAAATFKGNSWTGQKVAIRYEFAKKAGAWSCTSVSRAATVVRAQ